MKYTQNVTMKTVQTTFLLLIFCLLGCTSTHTLRPGHAAGYASLNKHAVGKQAMVTFVDGRKIKVNNLRITPDSTYWAYINKIATSQISEVQFRPGRRVKRLSLAPEADQTSLYKKINKRTRGRLATLILKDGQALRVRQLWMTPDSTSWIDAPKQQPSPAYLAAATSQIKEVRFFSRGKGAVNGGAFGSILGFVVGFGLGGCSPNAFVCIPREAVGVAFGLTGALIAAPIGAIKGKCDIYKIEHETATGTN